MDDISTATGTRKRSRGVTIVGCLEIAIGAMALLRDIRFLSRYGFHFVPFSSLIAVLTIIVGVLILKLKPWGRILTLILSWLSLLSVAFMVGTIMPLVFFGKLKVMARSALFLPIIPTAVSISLIYFFTRPSVRAQFIPVEGAVVAQESVLKKIGIPVKIPVKKLMTGLIAACVVILIGGVVVFITRLNASKEIKKDYWPSGQLSSETPYRSGKKHGLRRRYFKTGELSSEEPYVNGKMHGIFKVYYRNGNLSSQVLYKHGKQHGTGTQYYETGEVLAKEQYKNGKLEGIKKEFYRSGRLKSEAPYLKGRIEGVEKQYYETGQLRSETPYRSWIRQGTRREYYENGNLKSEVAYKDNKIEGAAKFYHKSGYLNQEEYHENGKFIYSKQYDSKGNLTAEKKHKYYDTGELESIYTLRDGKLQGIVRLYYKSGKVETAVPYDNGKINGVAKDYYEDGTLKTEETYKNDVLHGISREYDKSGRLVSEATYKDGIIIKSETYNAKGELISE